MLAEIEDLLRTFPPRNTILKESEEKIAWLGRATAVVNYWNYTYIPSFNAAVDLLHMPLPLISADGYRKLMTILHQARHELRMETVGPVSVALATGMVFDYFDEIRKVIEATSSDILFVDPYLDAEFVSRYLVHVPSGVTIRLLTRKNVEALIPAVKALAEQTKARVQVRTTAELHDRYIFVDGKLCYQSGASFKDGAKRAPTTLTQITDAFSAMLQTYEDLWRAAKPEL